MKRSRDDERKLAEFERWEAEIAELVQREMDTVHRRVPKPRTDFDERED